MTPKIIKKNNPVISLTYDVKLLNKNEKLFIRQRINKIVELLSDFEDFNITGINFKFCSDKTILVYNSEFLKHNYETDILTFEYDDDDEITSDIIISVETVRKNAITYRQDFRTEISRVIIHGLLHLCGYKDKTVIQKKQMKSKENFYLNKV